MSRLLIVLVAGFAVTFTAFGQDKPQQSPAAALQLDEVQFDFGKLKVDTKVEHAFHFKNTSATKTVTIKDVHASCGCTAAAPSKKVIAPGEAGQIDVSFDPRMRQGKERKVVTIETDDADAPKSEVVILAEVIPKIMVEPLALYMGEVRYDEVAKADPPMKKKIVITVRGAVCTMKSSTIDDQRITLRELGHESVDIDGEKSERYSYEVALEKNVDIGRINSQVVVETSDAERPKIYVPVIIDAVGELRFSQYPLYLRMSAPNEPVTAEFQLMSRALKPFKITGAEVDGGGKMALTVTYESLPDGKDANWKLVIKGTAPAEGTSVQGKLIVKTDIPTQPTIEVPVTGYVPAGPAKH